MKVITAILCALVPSVLTQSEILYKFLKLDRGNLSISKSCNDDLNLIDFSLERQDIWALKCKYYVMLHKKHLKKTPSNCALENKNV